VPLSLLKYSLRNKVIWLNNHTFIRVRKTGQRGKVVNAENWSMRKSGQRGKVVNGKLVNEKKAQKSLVFALN
jgi:hypothetical protein